MAVSPPVHIEEGSKRKRGDHPGLQAPVMDARPGVLESLFLNKEGSVSLEIGGICLLQLIRPPNLAKSIERLGQEVRGVFEIYPTSESIPWS